MTSPRAVPAVAVSAGATIPLPDQAGPAWSPQARVVLLTTMLGGVRRLADLLGVAPSQPSRWATGETVPGLEMARLLVDLDHVIAHCSLVWAEPEVVRDWLTTPNAHLDGLTPAQWLRTDGSAEVVAALRAEAAGAYA